MNTRGNRGARAALLALEAEAAIARGGFGCMFSSADEYERALISERRARGRYARPKSPWPIVVFGGSALLLLATALLLMQATAFLLG